MTDSLRDSYEAAPYESRAILASHIDALAVTGRLRGVDAPPAERCRVLELGSASGGNIVPMAIDYPGSTFVGIDLAPSQIADGIRFVRELGLDNVQLIAGSIADIDADFGEFDYIICHGVYSWVPAEVQDAILGVCSRNLAPNGVAYVSYNTFPGWHARMILREMLIANDDPTLPPAARVARARAFAERVGAEEVTPPTLHMATLREQVIKLRTFTDTHLLHEQLEPYNAPVYFAEFLRRSSRHGLQFLAEAPLWETRAARAGVQLEADGGADEIAAEQYFDYVRGRMFRRTLLCHDRLSIRRDFDISRLPELHATIRARPVSPSAEDLARDASVQAFASDDDITMATNNPLVIATIRVIGAAGPTSLSFPEIVTGVRDRLRGSSAESAADSGAIADVLMHFVKGGFIHLRSAPSRFVGKVSDRPEASRLARLQVRTGEFVTGMQHHPIRLSGLELLLLPLLDGRRDRRELVAAAAEATAKGQLVIENDKGDSPGIEELVDTALERLRIAALLVA